MRPYSALYIWLRSDHSKFVHWPEYEAVVKFYGDRRAEGEIALSPLNEVNDMLRADKVQNHFDFLRLHERSHPRREALARYFHNWFVRLDLVAQLDELQEVLRRRRVSRAPTP